jgi:hypothetical protein
MAANANISNSFLMVSSSSSLYLIGSDSSTSAAR